MRIVFLGSVSENEQVQALSGGSVAGNKMQLSIIENLVQLDNVEVVVISIPSVAAYPHDKKIRYKRTETKLRCGCVLINIAFTNVPLLKQFQQAMAVYREAKKYNDTDTVYLSFNLFPQNGLPMKWLAKRQGAKTASVLADLPIDDGNGRESRLMNIFYWITKKCILSCGNLIVLNQKAVKLFHPKARYMVIEGGVDVQRDTVEAKCPFSCKSKKNIVFSGSLIAYNGILALLDAMALVQNGNITLDIYGDGPLRETVKKAADASLNICYRGIVANDEMMRIQREAWALINPRPVNNPIAQVTFPSKMFEYLLSGTPVLTTHLNCFSTEYDDLLYYCQSDDASGIARGIDGLVVLGDEVLMKRACFAREYVLSEKNWAVQTKKIRHFLEVI